MAFPKCQQEFYADLYYSLFVKAMEQFTACEDVFQFVQG